MKRAKILLSPFQAFVRSESASGLLLLVAALGAFLWATSGWGESYTALQQMRFGLRLGSFALEKPLLLWVNDGLMAVFFLFVGLEIKRELVVGELSNRRAAALPIVAALGGMVVPAGLYALLAHGGPAEHGWGVPMATDIAFALGIMALLGPRVPLALKVFLTALAIVDDLGAVLVIALFYTEELKVASLLAAVALWGLALAYNRLGGRRLGVFALLGALMWLFMLKSGVHATVAGVLLAFAIPMRREIKPQVLKSEVASLFRRDGFEQEEVEVGLLEDLTHRVASPLHSLEHGLHPWVAFAIMPLFAVFNTGFTLAEDASLLAPVPWAVFVGLLVGKPVGVVTSSWLAVRAGWCSLPAGVSWTAMLGTGLLAGIGFTMSLFIAALAFGQGALLDGAKLGVFSASLVAAVLGLGVLALGTRSAR